MMIATICARGGSVGVPRKNVRPLMGLPLLAHTIDQASACKRFDRIYVSTDDDEIATVARSRGALVPFKRPAELATSAAAKIPVIEHLVEWVDSNDAKVSTIVDLDPTSPLRALSDIDACIDLLTDDVDVVITGYVAEKNPYFNMVEKKEDGSIRLVKPPQGAVVSRQQAPAVYAMNGSVYVWHRHTLSLGLWGGNVRLHVMPRERSIDVDSEIDFQLVELLMRSRQPGPLP